MSVVIFLVPLSILLAGLFFVGYAWCVRNGQFEDLTTPAVRMLLDEEESERKIGRQP